MKFRYLLLSAILFVAAVTTAFIASGQLLNMIEIKTGSYITKNNNRISVEGWSGDGETLQVKRMNGYVTYFQIFVGEEGASLKMDYDFTVSNGTFQLVWIDKDLNAEVILESSDSGHKEYTLEPGHYKLKFVGINAAVECSTVFKATGDYEAYMDEREITEDIRAES